MTAAQSRSLKVLLGAWGEPGHIFPILALGERLLQRGHQVTIQTAAQWGETIESLGMDFIPGHVYTPGPGEEWLTAHEAAKRATLDSLPQVDQIQPDVAVSEILTYSTNLACELRGIPTATLIPHIDPRTDPDWPPYGFGSWLPVTGFGRSFWRRLHHKYIVPALEVGEGHVNGIREAVGLPAKYGPHNGLSDDLVLIGTVPMLEYRPESKYPNTHVVGPFVWEPKTDLIELPEGDEPLVVIAPSTSQDPDGKLLRHALAAASKLPVRVLASSNKRPGLEDLEVPANATLVPWMSYSQVFPAADVIICHAGHGTLLRALQYGKPVIAIPIAGDMFENSARLAWSGAGLQIPSRFVGDRVLKAAIKTAISDKKMRAKAQKIAEWISSGDAPSRAIPLIEALAQSRLKS